MKRRKRTAVCTEGSLPMPDEMRLESRRISTFLSKEASMANSKKQFYEVGSYSGSMREGSEICIQRHIIYQGQYADFKPFLNIPQKEL